MNTDMRKTGALLTIPLFLLIIAALAASGDRTVFEPPFLLPVLNTLFLGLIPLSIAYVAGRTYRANGSLSVLLLGSGMLVFGLGSIAAGWLNGLPGGSNITPTIHNTAVCIGALFSLAAVVTVYASPRNGIPKGSGRILLGLYGATTAFAALFSYLAVTGAVPPFFIQGTGPTLLRQIILGNAMELYVLAALLFYVLYRRKQDDFFFWFSVALGLVSIGLLAVLLQPAVGSALGWTGRCAQYTGAVFALAAMISARKEAAQEGVSLTDQISRFFDAGDATPAILSAVKDSVWLYGTDGSILIANPTALERIRIGTAGDVIGHDFREFISQELAVTRRERMEEVMHTRQPVRFEDEQDGIIFDHSFFPVFNKNGHVTAIAAFSRDITAAKKGEQDLKAAHERTTAILQQIADTFYSLDREWRFETVNPAAEKAPFGRPASELIGRVIWDLYPGLAGTRIQQHYFDAARNKSLEHYEAQSPLNGRWYEVFMQGRTGGVDVYMRDITVRREAEEALRLANKRYDLVLQGSGAGIWDWDIPNHSVVFSKQWKAMRGYAEDEIAGSEEEWNRGIHPDDYSRVMAALQAHIEGKTPVFSEEYRIRKKDGSWIWILDEGTALRDADGTVIRMAGSETDITQRRAALEALRESEGRFRALAETSPLAIGVSSHEGKFLYLNKAYEDLFGYTAAELETVGASSLWRNPDDRHAMTDALGKQGSLMNYEAQLRRKDGTFFPALLSLSRINYSGEPAVMGTVYNISERKAAEEELEKTNAKLSEVLSSIGDDFYVLDREWKFVYANHQFTSRVEKEPKDFIGNVIWDIFPRHRGTIFEENLKAAMENRETRRFEIHGSYTDAWYSLRAFPSAEGVTVLGTDITDRKRAEGELRKKQAEIQALFDNIPAGLVLFDADPPYRVLVHNRFYQELFAEPFFSRGMAGMSVYEYAPGIEASGVEAALDEAVRTMQPRQFLDFPYRANPAKETWFNWYLAPIELEGRVVSIVSMSLDITDRHLALEALKQSESQLRRAHELLDAVTKSSEVMIAAEDRDLCYTYFNKAYAEEIRRITGKDPAIGMSMSDLFADLPDEKVNSERQWKKVLEGNSIKETVTFESPGGGRRIFSIIHTPIRDGTGAIIGAGEVSFELTRQIRIQEELRETSKYLENLIRYANAPIIVWDPEFRITRFNRAFERLTGLIADDVIGKTPDILIPEKHRQGALDLIRRATTGDRWEVVEIPIRHRSGKIRTVLWNSATLYGDDGKTVIATIAQGQEITERKEAEDQMRVEKKRAEEALSLLNAALEATTEGIYVVDSSRRVTSYNQNFVALWNIPGDLIASRDDQKISRFMQDRVEGQKDFAEHLTEIYQHPERESYDMLTLLDGRIFERHSRPQRLGKGIIGRVWSYLDVTDWRLAERSLVASVHEKEILIREIHHRVKNNLQIISGLLDMTRMRTPDSMTSGILTDMMMKIKTMAQIHTRLYESKQFERINMGSQIRDQVTDLSSIYGRSGAEIETRIRTEDFFLPVDQAIPCALIVNEVLSNSFKHAFTGRKSGTLDVTATQADGRIRIRIRDDGVGIPKDVDPDRTTSLGLKLIRSLVQQLNGSVAIKNNHGTEVAVEFPLPAGGR